MSLVNKEHTRRFLLDYAARTRAHKFTRVSPEAIERAEALYRIILTRVVEQQPSKGVTIR